MLFPESAPKSQDVVLAPNDQEFVKALSFALSEAHDNVAGTSVRLRVKELRPRFEESKRSNELTGVIAFLELQPTSASSTKLDDLLRAAHLTYSFRPGRSVDKQVREFSKHLRTDLTHLILDASDEAGRLSAALSRARVESSTYPRLMALVSASSVGISVLGVCVSVSIALTGNGFTWFFPQAPFWALSAALVVGVLVYLLAAGQLRKLTSKIAAGYLAEPPQR